MLYFVFLGRLLKRTLQLIDEVSNPQIIMYEYNLITDTLNYKHVDEKGKNKFEYWTLQYLERAEEKKKNEENQKI